MLTRRDLLARGLALGAGITAVGVLPRSPLVTEAQAAYSAIPASYSIVEMLQDNLANTITSMNDHFDVAQGSRYQIELCWTPMAGKTRGWLVFREQDASNFYQLDFFPDRVALARKIAGVLTRTAQAPRLIDASHPAMLTLEMNGATFTVTDQSGSTVVLQWTDPDSTFPVGYAVSHYTGPGCSACWEFVRGRPIYRA